MAGRWDAKGKSHSPAGGHKVVWGNGDSRWYFRVWGSGKVSRPGHIPFLPKGSRDTAGSSHGKMPPFALGKVPKDRKGQRGGIREATSHGEWKGARTKQRAGEKIQAWPQRAGQEGKAGRAWIPGAPGLHTPTCCPSTDDAPGQAAG